LFCPSTAIEPSSTRTVKRTTIRATTKIGLRMLSSIDLYDPLGRQLRGVLSLFVWDRQQRAPSGHHETERTATGSVDTPNSGSNDPSSRQCKANRHSTNQQAGSNQPRPPLNPCRNPAEGVSAVPVTVTVLIGIVICSGLAGRARDPEQNCTRRAGGRQRDNFIVLGGRATHNGRDRGRQHENESQPGRNPVLQDRHQDGNTDH